MPNINQFYQPNALEALKIHSVTRDGFSFCPAIQKTLNISASFHLRSIEDAKRFTHQSDLNSTILFSNPFKTEGTEFLYKEIVKQQKPHLIIERGALPGTIFLDSSGFLGNSNAHSVEFWDNPNFDLTEEEWLNLRKAILKNRPLERQGKV